MTSSVRTLTAKKGLATLASLALLLGACGDGDSVTEAGAEDGSIEDLEWESPIADFLGEDTSFDFDSDEAQAEQAELEAAAQEQIVLCMREEGFEYIPEDNSSFIAFETEDNELPWGSRAWTEKHGFGITTQRFGQSMLGPDLVGYDDSQFEAMDEEYEDPNQEYVESLSDGEQQAYWETLHGSEPDMPEDATEEEMQEAYENWEPDGCYNSAYEDMWGGDGWNKLYEEFGDELQALEERVEGDQRVIDFRAEVTTCVADKGYEYSSMQDLYELFETKMEGIGPNYGMGDPLEAAGLSYDDMTEDEVDDFYRDLEKLDDEDKARLAELQQEEITLAIAVYDCGGSTYNEAQVMADIRVEYEERFLEENKDRLAELEGIAGS